MVEAIKIMMEEHQLILKALKTARQMCKAILNNGNWDAADFFQLLDFVRNYADKYHHGKEEAILFKLMEEELGPHVAEGPIRGMLVEHDLGRLYMSRLENALNQYRDGDNDARLDIIANTISYTHLLQHHITTEDNTLYPFAAKRLKAETLEKLENEVKKLEYAPQSEQTRERYQKLMEKLENKYN